MYSCYVHGWSSHHSMCPACQVVTTSTGTAGTNQITNTEIDLAFESVSLEDKYKSAIKMLEEMARALEYYDGVHRLNWAINFDDLTKKAKDQLDKYKKWKAGGEV